MANPSLAPEGTAGGSRHPFASALSRLPAAAAAVLLGLALPQLHADEAPEMTREQALAERVWTARDGRETRASFVRLEGDQITIKSGNREFTLPMIRFSPEDRTWAEAAQKVLDQPVEIDPSQMRAEIPTLTARTGARGRSVQVIPRPDAAPITVRTMAAEAEVFFFNPPSQDYTVECFFVAIDDQSRDTFLFGASRETSSEQRATFSFESPPLGGTVRRSVGLALRGRSQGRPPEGSEGFMFDHLYDGAATSARVQGWVIRVISNGEVVRLESNQGPLKLFAERHPEILDQARP